MSAVMPLQRGITAPVAVLLSTLQLFKYAGRGEKGPGGRSLVTDQSTPWWCLRGACAFRVKRADASVAVVSHIVGALSRGVSSLSALPSHSHSWLAACLSQ